MYDKAETRSKNKDDRKFQWNRSKNPFRQEVHQWCQNQPDNALGLDWCAALVPNSEGKPCINDLYCTLKQEFGGKNLVAICAVEC